jgi:hypothetical protein
LQWYSLRALLVAAALLARGTALLGLARLRTLFVPSLPAAAAAFTPPVLAGQSAMQKQIVRGSNGS